MKAELRISLTPTVTVSIKCGAHGETPDTAISTTIYLINANCPLPPMPSQFLLRQRECRKYSSTWGLPGQQRLLEKLVRGEMIAHGGVASHGRETATQIDFVLMQGRRSRDWRKSDSVKSDHLAISKWVIAHTEVTAWRRFYSGKKKTEGRGGEQWAPFSC